MRHRSLISRRDCSPCDERSMLPSSSSLGKQSSAAAYATGCSPSEAGSRGSSYPAVATIQCASQERQFLGHQRPVTPVLPGSSPTGNAPSKVGSIPSPPVTNRSRISRDWPLRWIGSPGYLADAFFADTFLVSTFFAGAFLTGVGAIARLVRSMPMTLISSTRGCAPVTDAQ